MRIGGPHCGVSSSSTLGGEVFERMLLTHLAAQGNHIEIGLPASRAVQDAPAEWTISLLRPGRGLRWYFAPIAFVPYTLRLLHADLVDVLRGHSVLFTGPSLLLARALTRSRVPVVLQHHHSEGRRSRLEAYILRRADAVFTVSEFSRRQLIALGVPSARIHVVAPGTDEPVDPVDPLPTVWPSSDGLRLLFLSRLIERKRPQIALETVAELQGRGVRCSLVVAGSGPLSRELATHAERLAIADSVRFVGTVRDSEKWGLYDGADLLLFPSRLEGFGMVVAEAQLRGLPAVVAMEAAVSDIVEHGRTGLVVNGDAGSFADAVERLVREGGLQELRAATLRAPRMDWDRAAAETARILTVLVSGAEGRLSNRS